VIFGWDKLKLELQTEARANMIFGWDKLKLELQTSLDFRAL
jgi:hypothetical protein